MDHVKSIKLIKTEDGSSSVYNNKLDETYHSIHGAVQESQHVFIENGLNYYLSKEKPFKIKILEFGFGTGLNALLTLKSCAQMSVHFESLEKYPLPIELISRLNYSSLIGYEDEFSKMHTSAWDNMVEITPNFVLKKVNIDFNAYQGDSLFNIIYFDAFAPSKQPELWQKEVFERCYNLLSKNGILVTYSAKGQLKRDLKAIGFKVESPPGPPGKFEMTRAIKLDS